VADRWAVGILAGDSALYWKSDTDDITGGTARMTLSNGGNLSVTGTLTGNSIILRDTSAAFTVAAGATSSSTLTANRTLTVDVANANRTLKMTGNLTLDGAGTISVASGKTGTFSNSITISGTDGNTLNVGAGGTLGTAAFTASSAYQPVDAALTALATGSDFVVLSGPTTSNKTKTMRDASDTILELGGSYTPTGTWTNMVLATPTIGGTATTGVAGSGKVVLDTSPTISAPSLTGTTALANATYSGKITNYNGTALFGLGLPSQVATVDLTGQTAAKSATTLVTPAADGWYRLSAILKITTTGTSPVAGPITITYNDGDGNVAQSQVMLMRSTTGTVVTTTVNNSTTTGTINGDMVFYAKSGTAIQYAIAVSGTFGAGQYSAHLRLEAL
jgi:phage gp45-like